MNQPSDAVLEFAAILGEAIARVHLAGKNANAQVDDGLGVRDFVGLTKESSNDEQHNTYGAEATGGK